jgi:hypothetical protein
MTIFAQQIFSLAIIRSELDAALSASKQVVPSTLVLLKRDGGLTRPSLAYTLILNHFSIHHKRVLQHDGAGIDTCTRDQSRVLSYGATSPDE